MAVEDFTTYAEGDGGSVITVTSTKITFNGDGYDTPAYVSKDFGVNNFDSIDAIYEMYLTSIGNNYPTTGGIGFADAGTNQRVDMGSTEPWSCFVGNAGTPQLRLVRGSFAASDIYNCSTGTLYYVHMERASGNDTVTLKIYSDSGRTTLVDTLSLSGLGTDKWRYCYGFIHHDAAEAGCNSNSYVQNLDLQEAAAGGGGAPAPTINLLNVG